jgi:hypothetical protein
MGSDLRFSITVIVFGMIPVALMIVALFMK